MTDPRSRREYLRTGAIALASAVAGCSAPFDPAERVSPPTERDDDETDGETDSGTGTVDDWQFDPDEAVGRGTAGGGTKTALATATQSAGGAKVGLAAGGAKGVSNYRDNIEESYLPIPTDLSYEGLFYDYYFETGGSGTCDSLFCPSYSSAIAADPFSGETEHYLTVGLNSGLGASAFERRTLNLVVVLDISGSMSSEFDQYYYDRYGNRHEVEGEGERPKIDVAADAVAELTTHLRDEDRFGMVVFNDDSYVAKPVRAVGETDMDAIRGHVRELKAGGGTRLSAGVGDATELLSEYAGADPSEYETRMIVATDAMPNLGDTDEGGLLDRLEGNAGTRIYTTFVGIGVDFNTELVDAITAVEGANYYAVHSAEGFERRLDEEFEYMVTPLAFDVTLELDADGYGIEKVYGSTAAEEATGEMLHVNTLFPSPKREGRTRGGVVLAKLKRRSADPTLRLAASWETRAGERRRTTETVTFPGRSPDYFANPGVRKAVLLTRYADLMKNWMVYERTREGEAGEDAGIDVAPEDDELGRWERRSTELAVSPAYRERFEEFAGYFASEMEALDDPALEQELEILRDLAEYGAGGGS